MPARMGVFLQLLSLLGLLVSQRGAAESLSKMNMTDSNDSKPIVEAEKKVDLQGGALIEPTMRGCDKGATSCTFYEEYGPQAVVGPARDADRFLNSEYQVCRGAYPGANVIDVEAGETLHLKFHVVAPRPGDCALYVSYDGDDVEDSEKRWALIWKKKDCLCLQTPEGPWPCSFYSGPNDDLCLKGCPQTIIVDAKIPSWLPASGNVVFHWEWYTTQSRETQSVLAAIPPQDLLNYPFVPLYSGCFDGSVVGSPFSVRPSDLTGLVTMRDAAHLPTTAAYFRSNTRYNDPDSFPRVAGIIADWAGPAGGTSSGAETGKSEEAYDERWRKNARHWEDEATRLEAQVRMEKEKVEDLAAKLAALGAIQPTGSGPSGSQLPDNGVPSQPVPGAGNQLPNNSVPSQPSPTASTVSVSSPSVVAPAVLLQQQAHMRQAVLQPARQW
eukprot:gb/GEZN01008302.1/.p1 GENE.gb/GEZN01008302.1/~~gb/GEZN01008302.1/.p1  ORF type:complete len:441 (-),score=53.61 gb/GEZN01008302.1/:102-1424(-)